ELALDADAKQFAAVYAKLQEHGERGAALLRAELNKNPGATAPVESRIQLAKRQSNAGVGLLRLGRTGDVWPLLKHSPDPTVRGYLIHSFKPLGAQAGDLVAQLDKEADVTIRGALLLSLGEFEVDQLPSATKAEWIAKITQIYQEDAD